MKIRITLSRMCQQTKTVKVPDDFHSWDEVSKRRLMSRIYSDDGGDRFIDRNFKEAEHIFLNNVDESSDHEFDYNDYL